MKPTPVPEAKEALAELMGGRTVHDVLHLGA